MLQFLREVWKVTERKDGCIYKTQYIEDRWIEYGEDKLPPDNNPDLMWVSKSTSFKGKTIRNVWDLREKK